MGLLSRRKGRAFEQAVARAFREAMPGADIKRGLQSRGGGKEVPDVDMPCFHVECKHGKKMSPRAALLQASEDCLANEQVKWPVAVIKDDGKDPFVVMDFEEFLDLVKEWWELSRR